MFFFTASDGSLLYMGKDKHENEGLIKHGWPEDVWFHVDNLSSAHVYLRLPARADAQAPPASAAAGGAASSASASTSSSSTAAPLRWDALPEALLAECGQLCKANSIEGSKKASVAVIYTPWSNLRKDGSMDVGQVGFVVSVAARLAGDCGPLRAREGRRAARHGPLTVYFHPSRKTGPAARAPRACRRARQGRAAPPWRNQGGALPGPGRGAAAPRRRA
jgi:hypothetical protein